LRFFVPWAMTSFAFILGILPLVIAEGRRCASAGKPSARRSSAGMVAGGAVRHLRHSDALRGVSSSCGASASPAKRPAQIGPGLGNP